MAANGSNGCLPPNFGLFGAMGAQNSLGNVSESPLGMLFEGENGKVLATIPFDSTSQGVTAENMSLMGFPSRNAFSGSPHGGEGEVSFENALGFCKTGPSVLEISSPNVSASPTEALNFGTERELFSAAFKEGVQGSRLLVLDEIHPPRGFHEPSPSEGTLCSFSQNPSSSNLAVLSAPPKFSEATEQTFPLDQTVLRPHAGMVVCENFAQNGQCISANK